MTSGLLGISPAHVEPDYIPIDYIRTLYFAPAAFVGELIDEWLVQSNFTMLSKLSSKLPVLVQANPLRAFNTKLY